MKFTSHPVETSLPSRSFATIGHSNRSLESFVGMLKGASVDLIIDVRAFPHSRNSRLFNIETLPQHLDSNCIAYKHYASLGGRRALQPNIDPQTNAWWKVQSFHNYADYALSDTFSEALDQILELARTHNPCLMCAEAVWWRCHRRIISDYLLANGCHVRHLISPGRTADAFFSAGAVVAPAGKITYPKVKVQETEA